MDQVVQVVGSVLVLAAFVGAQVGKMPTTSRIYLTLNLAGSIVLATVAAVGLQLGFLLLEGCWAAVSAWQLGRTFRVSPP